jgi:tellurite resistance protein TerB
MEAETRQTGDREHQLRQRLVEGPGRNGLQVVLLDKRVTSERIGAYARVDENAASNATKQADDNMTGLLKTLRGELQRFRTRRFLDAAMAAAAYLALADEKVKFSERLALDCVLETMNELKIFDVHKAVDLFRDYAEAIQHDRRTGRDRVIRAVSKFACDQDSATLLLKACLFIAKADGVLNEEESAVLEELCSLLRVNSSDLEIVSKPGVKATMEDSCSLS